ncbi:hypothetical protein [Paenibacillus chitinolyticus]|uniref:hypothetical protein n=1 Tax=Paenibacillus chitinolyticus TaxID=79263 RepID=UPI00366B4139
MKVTLQETPEALLYYGLTISQWVTLIAILVTLIVGVINLYSTMRTNKRTTYVNAVTAERVKWIGQLRELTSEYLMLTAFYEKKPLLVGEELDKFLQKLIFLEHRIGLHLNPSGEKDIQIIELLKQINQKIRDIYIAKEILEARPEDRLNLAVSFRSFEEKFNEKVGIHLEGKDSENISNEEFIAIYNRAAESMTDDFKKDFGSKGFDQLVSLTEKLIDLTSKYLKEEWERVKTEAQDGKLKK